MKKQKKNMKYLYNFDTETTNKVFFRFSAGSASLVLILLCTVLVLLCTETALLGTHPLKYYISTVLFCIVHGTLQ